MREVIVIPTHLLQAGLLVAPRASATRRVLCGIFIDTAGYMVATNGSILIASKIKSGFDEPMILDYTYLELALKNGDEDEVEDGTAIFRVDEGRAVMINGITAPVVPGPYPDWRSRIPGASSGEQGYYNPSLLAIAMDAFRLACDEPKHQSFAIHQNGLKDPAFISSPYHTTVVLIMPWSVDGYRVCNESPLSVLKLDGCEAEKQKERRV